MRLRRGKRSGAAAVETAFIIPVTLLLLLGMMVGAAGIMRYQEVAALARRAARYASVHGTLYAKDAKKPAPTPADIINTQVKPYTYGLDQSKLSCAISYNTSNVPYHPVTDANGVTTFVTNSVTVTVSYQWLPEAFFPAITLTSTSVMPMSY